MNSTLEIEPTETEARLASYLDGELDDASRRAVETALEQDPALREDLDRLVALRELLAGAPEAFAAPDPGELAFERTRRSIHDSLAPTSRIGAKANATVKSAVAKRTRRIVIGFVVAAAAAAAITVVALGNRTGDQPAVATNPAVLPPAPSMNGTEIVRVEFGKMSGTYWEQTEGDDRIAIVWIDDSFPEEVGRP